MTDREKLAMLEELMELDEGSLSAELVLENIEEWDSMTKLSLIVLMSDEFDVDLSKEDLKGFKVVGDILEKMAITD